MTKTPSNHRETGLGRTVDYMLKGIEETAIYTLKKINTTNTLMDDAIALAKEKLPSHACFKKLLFEQPYGKVKFLADNDIAKRQTAAEYLQELVKIG